MEYGDDILYKLWLNIQCGHDPKLISKFTEKSAEDIFNSSVLYDEMHHRLPLYLKLSASRSLDKAKELYEFCEENGIKIIGIDDNEYPDRLRQIQIPPQVLYVKGELPDIDKLVCITIVGSRKCSQYGVEFTRHLATELSQSGILIVSGMANGADTAAHNGALDSGMPTVAVLAGGVDIVYPKSNLKLYNEILTSGAVISERPPLTEGRPEFYRQRNRILAGLSQGVVIVEGEKKSGTKLTATWANTLNRDLFAVPGKPTDKGSALPNNLIKDSAKLITSAEDVIEEYISVYPVELKNGMDMINKERIKVRERKFEGVRAEALPTPKKRDFSQFEGNLRTMLEYLDKNTEAKHADEISADCNIDTAELSFVIIQLLMQKVIKELPGEYYTIA